jgi:hypothetical protein
MPQEELVAKGARAETARDGTGGAIDNAGTATISGCTISGNGNSEADGGGIANFSRSASFPDRLVNSWVR